MFRISTIPRMDEKGKMDKEGDLRSRTSTRCALRYGGKQTAEIERKEKQISIIVAYLTTTPDFFSKRTSTSPPFTLFHAVIRPFSVFRPKCKLEIYFSNKVEEKTFARTKDKRTLRSPKRRKQIIIVFVPNFLDGLEKGSRQDTAWGRMCAFEEEWREIDKDCTADCKTCLPSPRSIPR